MKNYQEFLENAELEKRRKELLTRSQNTVNTFNKDIQTRRKLGLIQRLRDKLKKTDVANDSEVQQHLDDEEREAKTS